MYRNNQDTLFGDEVCSEGNISESVVVTNGFTQGYVLSLVALCT